jgi:hypothetical protein
VIDELKDHIFAFVNAEYREGINGILPTLTASFICETDKFPLYLNEVNLTLTVQNDEWRIKGNVDEFRFNENTVKLFITLIDRDFYFTSKSNKYLSVTKAIESLYPGEIESDLTDNDPRELNQVNNTDYKYLNNMLRSLKYPSVFSYNMNVLKIKDLNIKKIKHDFDPQIDKYHVYERMNNYSLERNGFSESSAIGLFARDGEKDTTLTTWDGMEVIHNKQDDDLVINLIDNTRFQKQNRLVVRLVFQYIPPAESGDIVRVDLPNISQTEFVVIERLGIVGKDIKWSLKLREI